MWNHNRKIAAYDGAVFCPCLEFALGKGIRCSNKIRRRLHKPSAFLFVWGTLVSVVRKTPTDLDGWKKEYLIEALQEMFGEECVHVATEGEKLPVVGERYGRQQGADIVVKLDNGGGDIGFDLNAETDKFEVVGDWYMVGRHRAKLEAAGLERTDRVGVVSGILQKTNHAFMKKGLKKKGFKKSTIKKVITEDGEEVLEARFTKGGF